MPSDSGEPIGEIARADYTVTFTAPKVGQVLAPNCDHVGELAVCPIGSPAELYEKDDAIFLSLVEPAMFRHLLAPRPPSGHKGTFGHVLVIAGSRGKTGAAAMSGMSSLRAGAGLVTVASASSAIPIIAGHAAELMTEPLEENESGGISRNAPIGRLAEGMTVIAMGPGMGRHPDTEALTIRAAAELEQPMVIDADALTAQIHGRGKVRVMTPHPGEMGRLTGKTIAEVQKDRVGVARAFAMEHAVALVLKGQRSRHCVSRWRGVDQPHRHSGPGNRWHGRYPHGPHRRLPRTVSARLAECRGRGRVPGRTRRPDRRARTG